MVLNKLIFTSSAAENNKILELLSEFSNLLKKQIILTNQNDQHMKHYINIF